MNALSVPVIKSEILLGLGQDLVDIRRIKKVYERWGEQFIDRILSPQERVLMHRFSDSRKTIEFLAKRFSLKEACAKALGTGFGAYLSWQDVTILNDKNGRPVITLDERVINTVQDIYPGLCSLRALASLSDEPPFALAGVILMAVFHHK